MSLYLKAYQSFLGKTYMELFLIITSLIIIVQSIFYIYVMTYAWDVENHEPLKIDSKVKSKDFTFSVLLPAYKEEKVIQPTLESLSNLNYPKELGNVSNNTHSIF
ncbi:MAG: hypothetical protein ACRCXZ_01240 [Patescibacteria group bacterium]